MPGQALFDVPMTRYGLGDPRERIAVPIVFAAMTHQDTPVPLDRPDQIEPLHETTNSSTFRMPGNSPLVKS